LKRLNSVGKDVIMEQYNKYIKPKESYVKPVQNPELPNVIIVDVDGTLAHMKDRSPFDWNRVDEDEYDETIGNIVKMYNGSLLNNYTGVSVIIMSGRDSACYDKTYKWLTNHEIYFDKLLMRKHKDMRSDTIVKEELYNEHVKDKYNVLFVLDDRKSVVNQWRKMGLRCLEVKESNF
jgi:hypothetical protein